MRNMKIEMGTAAKITLLLLCCSVGFSTESESDCDDYAATGDDFTVTLKHHLKDEEKLKWRRGREVIIDRKPVKSGQPWMFLKGSRDDLSDDGSLKLKNLKKINEGEYIAEVFNTDGVSVPNIGRVRLCVKDRVPQPHVTVECSKSQVIYTCNVAKESKVTDFSYEWLQNNKVLASTTTQHLSQDANKVGENKLSCKVYNKVSSLISAPAPNPCYKSVFIFSNMLRGTTLWIIVGVGGGVVLLLIIVVIVCCVRAKRKKRNQMKDEEELRLQWTNDNQQQQHQCPQHSHHHHQHHQQQQQRHHHQQQQRPAGNTGPRQHRSKQPRGHELPAGQPLPSPRRSAQAPRSAVNGDEEQPPPLPQPRKTASRTPRE